uniref:Uncharacterized protein n=1 Tax=Brassica campestris TaxID=3711 RepID=A0A3P6BAB8_BRACM|nr:unnamed protein product [Brassica rapa]
MRFNPEKEASSLFNPIPFFMNNNLNPFQEFTTCLLL